jgi:uncharacterized protein YerC
MLLVAWALLVHPMLAEDSLLFTTFGWATEEMYAVLNDGFDKLEIEYLMQQWNFARKVREGRRGTPGVR